MPRPKAGAGWDERWRRGEGSSFAWHAEGPPQELERVLEGPALATGAALDLGCGEGAAARRIARSLAPTVGVDVSMEAVRRAGSLARQADSTAAFLVAEAPALPLQGGTFALIFDRGCLQNISRELWPAYFREVDRLLAPGGLLQLFVARPSFPPVLSPAGIRARVRHPRRALMRRSRRRAFDERLRRHVPDSMQLVSEAELPVTHGARRRAMVHLLARKAKYGGRRPSQGI